MRKMTKSKFRFGSVSKLSELGQVTSPFWLWYLLSPYKMQKLISTSKDCST